MRNLSLPWIAAAALAAALWTVSRTARGSRWGVGAALALWAGVLVALVTQVRLEEITRDWPSIREEVRERAAQTIGVALDDLVQRGDRAVDGLSQLVESEPDTISRSAVTFARIQALRRESGMSALAIYGPDGNPVAWAGEHRGVVPEFVRRGELDYAFHRGPLFGYLYFAHALPAEHTAVAAVLLDSSISPGEESTPFADSFAARHGLTPRFMPPERAEGEAVWDWATDRRILSVTFAALTQERWHAEVAERGRWGAGAAWLVALVLLSGGWLHRRVGFPGIPVAVATLALLALPLGAMTGAGGLFSPLHFVLAGPGDITLGELLILLVGIALWILARTPTHPAGGRIPLWMRAVAAACLVPVGLELIRRSASPGLLAAHSAGGFALILVSTLVLALPLLLLLRPSSQATHTGRSVGLLLLGSALAALFATAIVLAWRPAQILPLWAYAVWAVPFALISLGISRVQVPWRALLVWLAAGWLGGTAAASSLWIATLEARIDAAEAELAHLGTEADPFLDYLLRQFAERALFLAGDGEDGVNLLYRSWVASGLAREGYEARITLWTAGIPEAELRLSELQLPMEMAAEMITRARTAEEPLLERYTGQESLHYILLVPLPDDRVISVATPPRRRLGRATALARFLHPDDALPADDEFETLTLIPVSIQRGERHVEAATDPAYIRWTRTRSGWRSETTVMYPAGPMHAHLLVPVAPAWLLLVRGMLALVLILVVYFALWSVARTLCGEIFGVSHAHRHWIRAFRARLTLALFGFFLLPTLIFGAVAYQALSREVVRTAAALARHSLELAAPAVDVAPLPELGMRVRADLLLYRGGGLVGASAPEVLDLGIFQTWLPPSVEIAFASGEYIEQTEQRQLAGSPYLVAYRRLGEDGVLAAPIPLASGEIARRQRAFEDAFLLMMLLGAGLSVVLALLVGRALSRPIELLSRAAAAVGAGNLRLRLPEDRPDEFGGVYRSFNRMVRRLRRARSAEIRTARVLAWGEMARQVAHEIKNPLTPIKLSVQHLRRAYADGRADFSQILDRNVDAILQEIDRLGEIARAFARFGTPRASSGTLETLDLQRVVDETLVLYRGGKDEIRYTVAIAPDTPRVMGREGELKEVLLNLLENAREALDGAGEIRIAADPVGGGEWVCLDLSDTGPGIPPDLLPRIFEPQFSTRSSGTGLGLAIVRRLVESWGGEVSASSRPGEGATIHLRLRVES
ncbi:hypothetical protein BH23GEM3_BH23GEM3_02550 [soil metagenome]